MQLLSRTTGRRVLLPAIAALACPAAALGQSSQAQMPGQFERPAPPPPSAPALALSFGYAADLNADMSGGARRGVAYLGKAAIIADADLDRLLGWRGATAHASVIDIHGTGLSASRVGNLATVSGIEAEPALRLNQAWIEFGLGRRARLRLGKFPASQDFMASDTAALFINATFGWPASFAADLPQGGPSWPLAAPGAMIKAPLSAHWSLSAAVFAGTPAGGAQGDPQRIDDHGFAAFRFAGRPLTIVEVSRPLGDAATLKIGGWSHFGRFDRPGTAAGETLSPDWAVYALVDARIAGAADAARQLRVFARATWSPPDRNPVTGYADAGIELTAPIARRPRDAAGLAFATAWLSNRLPAANGPRAEHVLELSYRAAFGRYVTVQPNLQVVFDPVDPTTLIGRRETALIAGARFAAMF